MIRARAQTLARVALLRALAARDWLAAEAAGERGRWALWSPVALGAGAATYFQLTFVVPLWASLLVAAGAAAMMSFAGARAGQALVLSAATLFLFAGGMALADLRVRMVAAPMIHEEHGPAWVTGTIVRVENNDGGSRRLTIAPSGIEDLRGEEVPARVRLTVRQQGGEGLQPGDGVRMRGVLLPPSGPAMPGAFDFAQRSYFQGLGAVGYAISPPEAFAEGDSGWSVSAAIARIRLGLAMRIREALPGSRGGIAAALLTGDRSGIGDDDVGAMRTAGLAHLLAISGLHMMLVGGLLFLGFRSLLVLNERWALTRPVKKYAAVFALGGSLFYLLLSGGAISTQRAFIMIAIMFIAILADRPALTLRNVAVAALIVLVLAPEAVMQVSFQMSFAAVIALIAMSEFFGPKLAAWRGGVHANWPGRIAAYVGGLALSSVVAGLTIAPFAAYHFNRFSNFELFSNLIAMPLMAFWVMPWGIVAILLMPLGLEGLALTPMGWGIDGILWAAHGVSSWPGAEGAVASAAPWVLPVVAIGGLWFALWKRTWRFGGLALITMGLAGYLFHARPDVLVTGEGDALAIRDSDGALHVMNARRASFEQEIWLRMDGDTRALAEAAGGFTCDGVGCVGQLPGGEVVAYASNERALIDDCQNADILVTAMPVLIACPHPRVVIDYYALREGGAHSIRIVDDTWHLARANDRRRNRPWAAPSEGQ